MSDTAALILIGTLICSTFAAIGVLIVLMGISAADEYREHHRNISVTSIFSDEE